MCSVGKPADHGQDASETDRAIEDDAPSSARANQMKQLEADRLLAVVRTQQSTIMKAMTDHDEHENL